MSLKLPPNLAKILREIITVRRPDLLPTLDASQKLTQVDREGIRQALAAELVITGLHENDEPNARGKVLEEIIDKLGRL